MTAMNIIIEPRTIQNEINDLLYIISHRLQNRLAPDDMMNKVQNVYYDYAKAPIDFNHIDQINVRLDLKLLDHIKQSVYQSVTFEDFTEQLNHLNGFIKYLQQQTEKRNHDRFYNLR